MNESRARQESLSRDIYARSWIPPDSRPSVRELWDDYAENVYPHDDLELGLRNRYFLSLMEERLKSEADVLVNLGAGFTSYPFLLDNRVTCVEADQQAVTSLKKARMKTLIDEGALRERAVEIHTTDLNDPQQCAQLAGELAPALQGRFSIFLSECVLPYLDRAAVENVLSLVASAQQPGDLFALDYWTPEVTDHPVFQRQQRYFAERLGFAETGYSLLRLEDIAAMLPSYEIMEATNVLELEERYLATSELRDSGEYIPDTFAVFQKKAASTA